PSDNQGRIETGHQVYVPLGGIHLVVTDLVLPGYSRPVVQSAIALIGRQPVAGDPFPTPSVPSLPVIVLTETMPGGIALHQFSVHIHVVSQQHTVIGVPERSLGAGEIVGLYGLIIVS